MAVFPLILFIISSMFQSFDSTCGPPGISVGAIIHGHTSMADEGQVVDYECEYSFKQVYGYIRTCTRGKWTPRIPKCAIKESARLNVDNYKINYYDNKESIGLNSNRSFDYLHYIRLNSSRRFTFQVYYSPKARISYVELDLQILSDNKPNNLKVSLFINDFRECIQSSLYSNTNSVIEFKFICEAKSFDDYDIEGKDLPRSLKFSFESKNKFESRVIRISVFRFQNECGTPDIPQNVKSKNSGNSVTIYESKPERYKILDQTNDTIKCLFEGNWDKEFQQLYPIVNCPLEHFDWESSQYTNISEEYFEYFNDTLFAPVDSKIQFQCNNSENSSEFNYLYCLESGKWNRDIQHFNFCSEHGENSNEFGNESDFFVIIVTLVSTFVTTLTLTLCFGAIIVWRRKVWKKRKMSPLNVKSVKQTELTNQEHIFIDEFSYTTDHYESVDYQYVNSRVDMEDRPVNNHYYTQILE